MELTDFTGALKETVQLFESEMGGLGPILLNKGEWLEVFLIWLEERGWQLVK